VSALGRALLQELGPDDLAELARLLEPFLQPPDDGWLSVKAAAAYAGCTIPALRHAMRTGVVRYSQGTDGGRVYLRRSELDRWRYDGSR